jgi:catechol 2,3-dioxygenase-like lactoylglutathione lyase family enzyme
MVCHYTGGAQNAKLDYGGAMFRGGHLRVPVSDLPRAVRFYVETLGMKLVSDAKDAPVFDAGDGLMLCLSRSHGAPNPTQPLAALVVKGELPSSLLVLENRGIAIAKQDGHVRLSDSEGNVYELLSEHGA